MPQNPPGRPLRSYDSPADRIRQHRQSDKRPVVVVEGPTDKLLLEDAFDRSFAVFPAGSRDFALETARRLAEWNTPRFCCVVDRDFDDLVSEVEVLLSQVHAYENADLEAMLVDSNAFKRMAMELGSSEKISALGGIEAVRERLKKAVTPISILRRANCQESWGLAFDKVDTSGKVDRKTLELDIIAYCMALSQTVQNGPTARTLVEYATEVRVLKRPPVCPRGRTPYFRGRDVLCVTGVALRSKMGSCVKAISEVDHLEKVLRLSADKAIASSKWGKDLLDALAD